MIKANCGEVQLRGSKPLLTAELTTIVSALTEDGKILDKEDVQKAVELAYMSKEEVEAGIEKMSKKFVEDSMDSLIADMFRSIADDLEKGKED